MTQTNRKLKWTKIGLLLFFVGLDIFYNCTYPLKIEQFTYYKKPIQGKMPFRTDGYYYDKLPENDDNEAYQNKHFVSCFFHPDGFFHYHHFYISNNTFEEMDALVDTMIHFSTGYKNVVFNRGAFIVENDSVKVQFFSRGTYGDVHQTEGKILNDTTILLKIWWASSDTFHFRKLNWQLDPSYHIGFDKRIRKKKGWGYF